MGKPWLRYVAAIGILLVLAAICALPFLLHLDDADAADPSASDDATRESLLLEFTSNGDGSCYVSGIGECTDTDIIIPVRSPEGDIVTGIGKYAFYRCEAVESIALPESVTVVSANAFYDCTSLKSVTLPEGVESIGAQAFYGCAALKRIVIPASVTYIGRAVFAGCVSLGGMTVEEGNAVYHSKYHCIIETESKTLVAGCDNSTIPDDGSVSAIGPSAFAYCLLLEEIDIPEGVTLIGLGAFMGSRSLKKVTLPESLTVIDRSAFAGCISLPTLTLPEGLERINASAFESCTSLRRVTFGTLVGWRADGHRITENEIKSPQSAANYLTGQFLFNSWARDQ